MASDVTSLLGQVTWSEQSVSLFDLLKNKELPLLVKVTKGQYLSVGPGGLSSPGVHHTLLLISGGKRRRLVAQSVKFKDHRRVVPVGQKLLIPDSFDGLFEILSEEGRCVRAIESVVELARRFPDSCIVRENCKAYVSKSDNVETITERSRTIHNGETLVLVGEVVRTKGKSGPTRFLRCFDSNGENVYLCLDQKAKFSAVAKEENISGVHVTSNLFNKRLPFNVRMISGRHPDGWKLTSSFHPELRLYASYEDDLVIGIPLHKDGSPIAIATTAPLKLSVPSNADDIAKLNEFERLCDRGAEAWAEVAERILPFDVPLQDARVDGKVTTPVPQRPRDVRRNVSSPVSRVTRRHSGEVVDEYDEIDQIYDYVRGFAPLPKNLRAVVMNKASPERRPSTNSASKPVADKPPEPPPIETIPTRKVSLVAAKPLNVHPETVVPSLEKANQSPTADKRLAEKRSHEASRSSKKSMAKDESKPLSGKLFSKNANSRPKPRFFRHKSASPLKSSGIYYPLPGSVKLPGPSPIFSTRYKSLTNLAMDFDTLNSSNSGGKASGDSGDSSAIKAKLPEKKPKKLSRPKSMTNLVWEPSKVTPAMEAYVKPNLILDQERKLRLEPGVYKRRNSTTVVLNRFNSSQKKMGTLYL